MQQNFQDALAVCRHIGHPDIFFTMTMNPLWDEVIKMMKLLPHCQPQNSPDVMARVFRLKLDQLIDDIKKENYFGTCLGVMYIVEFQKRGLPHVHMLIWLDAASKLNLQANVDKFISAKIPDPEIDHVGYAAVNTFMVHGPCGKEFPKSPYMKQHKCTRHFPKKYCNSKTFDQSGFPIYKRRQTNIIVSKGKANLDNQWVVPYNHDLLVKYQCHINVEICAHARSLKYLFKYCLKGHDRAIVEIRAAYHIFGFNIHYRSLIVQRLSFHLDGNKYCTYRANEALPKVAERERVKLTQLEAFFLLNASDSNANKYLYDEIPQHYVWNDADHIWNPRKRGTKISRLSYTHHSAGELWFLRLLLTKVRGPTSFESLRTVNGHIFETFQGACKELGMLDDDNEWHQVLSQCSESGFPPQIRQLFVHIMVNCKVSDLRDLWEKHWTYMVDDILLKQQKLTGNRHLMLNEKQQQYYALAEIHTLLKTIGKSLKDFIQMPQPPNSYLDCNVNNLIIEETSYKIAEMKKEFQHLFSTYNKEQLEVYSAVMKSVEKNERGVFFVYGSGGCGKTFLWRTLIFKLRSECKIVLPVASSGIDATLMPGGRTTHSRFKIPIVIDEHSMCSISHTSDITNLIKRTNLIIWDEAPMQYRYAFECLDRSLRDIMKAVHPNRFHMPFGGITIVLGGDLRQIIPVIPRASRGEVVAASITRSKLWKIAKIGDGKVGPAAHSNRDYVEDDIAIPKQFCHLNATNSVDAMIESAFPNFLDNFQDADYLSDRAILTPTNVTFAKVNEYLNSINIPGLPLHELKLKVGVIVMLMQNLNQTLGLCNDMRMMVTKCLQHCVECEVIAGQYKGTKHFIPIMELALTETKLPFKLCRKQMSLQGLKLFIDDEDGNSTYITQNVTSMLVIQYKGSTFSS
ncbi:uncharacterized protein LOC141691974 [Apium graveolens]|uniref:uncharacterized protein LOC141691974 n=1 Tax=Apium graveolens TaxID=4045 RepID=UPI003D7B7CE1